jgi:hypothetical protein
MIQALRNANPVQIWIAQTFNTTVPLSDGRTIVVRFDLSSCDIFYDPLEKMRLAKAYRVEESVVDFIQIEMNEIGTAVYDSGTVSIYILDALEAKDWNRANSLLGLLAKSLVAIDLDKSQIWDKWFDKVYSYIKENSS